MNLIKQLFRFAGVGLSATVLHVLVALLAANGLGVAPLAANFCGFLAAVVFSYFGQSRLTFRTDLHHKVHAPRFATSALTGLVLSTSITHIVTHRLGGSFTMAMAITAIAVPLATFLLMRFWVFTPAISTDHKPPASNC